MVNEALIAQRCCACAVEFAMIEPHYKMRREDNKDFYCPNGHVQRFTVNQVEKLQADLAVKNSRVCQLSDANFALEEKVERLQKKLKKCKEQKI